MLPEADQTKLAYEFAKDVTEHLITLSTGVIAFSVTFTKELLQRVPRRSRRLLMASWLFLFASVFFGLCHILALTGELAPTPRSQVPATSTVNMGGNSSKAIAEKKSDQIIGDFPRLLSALQLFFFGLGIMFVLAYGLSGFRYLRSAMLGSEPEASSQVGRDCVINPS